MKDEMNLILSKIIGNTPNIRPFKLVTFEDGVAYLALSKVLLEPTILYEYLPFALDSLKNMINKSRLISHLLLEQLLHEVQKNSRKVNSLMFLVTSTILKMLVTSSSKACDLEKVQ
ncbi:MAG: hypothetical protein ACP5OC_00810 [Thermoplasmata archaeon]